MPGLAPEERTQTRGPLVLRLNDGNQRPARRLIPGLSPEERTLTRGPLVLRLNDGNQRPARRLMPGLAPEERTQTRGPLVLRLNECCTDLSLHTTERCKHLAHFPGGVRVALLASVLDTIS